MTKILLTSLLFLLMTFSAQAAVTESSFSYLTGNGFVSGDPSRNTYRFDTLTVGEYGVIYGRADTTSFDDANASVTTRLIGHLGKGFHLSANLQNQKGLDISAVGGGFSHFGAQSFSVDVSKMSSNYYGDGTHLFIFGASEFGGSFKVDGFIEVLYPEKGQDVYFAQPAISYVVNKTVSVGLEKQLYINKSGVANLNEDVTQLRLKVVF
jgi:hypothetical protein